MVASIDRVATVGENPWWVGTAWQEDGEHIYMGDENVTSEEMLVRGKQDWDVAVQPIFTELGLRTIRIENRKAVVRQDTGAVLGIVSNRYEPVQNRDAFKFFDEVVGEGQAIYHTAGSLGAGERAWILAKLPESVKIGGKDEIENYLLLVNGHDGNSAFRFFWTPIRVVCNNTLNFAIRRDEKSGFKLSHYRQINRKLVAADAREAIGLATDLLRNFTQEAEVLAQTRTTPEEIEGVLQRIFPLPTQLLLEAPKTTLLLPEPKREDIAPEFNIVFKKRDIVRTLINSGAGNTGETRWDVLNGVAEFTDYLQGHDRLRAQSLLFGNGQKLKQGAFDLLRRGITG